MRILAINDISCVGKCSLSVTLPIVSACGVTCDVLPTSLLSTHTGGFSGYTFRDLTEDMSGILAHWKTLGIQFDVIYSGYLGSLSQIRLVEQIKKDFLKENGIMVVDPVMGDNGSLYAGFDKAFVEEMKNLCRIADFILPNTTEACFLSGVSYPKEEQAYPTQEIIEKLKTLCPHPIVTGIHQGQNVLVSYVDEQGNTATYPSENVPGFFCGAGDVFASAFVGCLAKGKDVPKSVSLAAEFTAAAIRLSAKEVEDKRYGLCFEKELFNFLKNLNDKE